LAAPSMRSDLPHRPRRSAGEASPRVYSRQRSWARPADLAAVQELVAQSRRAQGLPDHVTDPIALDLVARLVIFAESMDEAPQAGVPP
jgi:hypothetical protein